MSMTKEERKRKSSRGSVLLAAEGDSWFEFPLRSQIVRELDGSGTLFARLLTIVIRLSSWRRLHTSRQNFLR